MRRIQQAFLLALCAFIAVVIVLLHFERMPYAFAYDPNEERCLPDLHLALLIKNKSPTGIVNGDLVFWKPADALTYVTQEFVVKQVAGIAGDRLAIKGDQVTINGSLVVTGLPLSSLYSQAIKDFERNEIIPVGKVFMIGTHPLSNDSRYWGYLNIAAIEGMAYKIY